VVVSQDKVVFIHYTLTDDAGQVIDSSAGGEPLAYLHGQGNIVAGLEKALDGRAAGDRVQVRVVAAEGYGVRDPALVKRVPRRSFGSAGNIRAGMQFQAQLEPGQRRVVTVTAVKGDMVTIDGNHPLAGQDLNFAVEIAEVRDATAEELAHGHVHGPGDHHHH
jgi:FKBP-type peptidyl-prolyl cis-trans isomerase SlyD